MDWSRWQAVQRYHGKRRWWRGGGASYRRPLEIVRLRNYRDSFEKLHRAHSGRLLLIVGSRSDACGGTAQRTGSNACK